MSFYCKNFVVDLNESQQTANLFCLLVNVGFHSPRCSPWCSTSNWMEPKARQQARNQGELYLEWISSSSKSAFTKALQKLIPEIQKKDLKRGGAGVRAQACDKEGGLIDDFLIFEKGPFINIGNAPSPAATSSLSIGDYVANLVQEKSSVR